MEIISKLKVRKIKIGSISIEMTINKEISAKNIRINKKTLPIKGILENNIKKVKNLDNRTFIIIKLKILKMKLQYRLETVVFKNLCDSF